MKSLGTIQTLAKVGKVLSAIVMILSIAALCIMVVGTVGYAFMGDRVIEIGEITIHSFISEHITIPGATLYTLMAICMVYVIVEIIISRYAVKYFKTELEDGTPFTERGASMLKKLGLMTIFLPLGAVILCAIGAAVAAGLNEEIQNIHFSGSVSIGLGIMFLVMSAVCRYGTEIREKAEGRDMTEGTDNDFRRI